MMKRIIALLLALILTVGLLPTVALAAEGDGETSSTNAEVVIGKYNDKDQWEPGTPTSTLPDGVKTVSKTAKPTTNDNEYEVTLQVVLQQTEENSGKAATVLVLDTSGSMAYCAECGAEPEDDCVHNYVKFNRTPNSSTIYYYKTTDKNGREKFEHAYYCDGNHTRQNHNAGWFNSNKARNHTDNNRLKDNNIYVKTTRTSRLDAAKVAAENFLKIYSGLTFKTDGTPADNQNSRNLGRYVSVVSFASGAALRHNWIDVSNANNYQSVLNKIKTLNPDGGTNLDAGLTYAEYLLNDNTVRGAVKNVIALTDGQPTYCLKKDCKDLLHLLNDELTIGNTTYCVHGNGKQCTDEIYNSTVATATRVKNVPSKIYTVCFDAGETIDVPNSQKEISVSEYLRTKIATQPKAGEKFAYDASNAEQLYAEFAKITQSIVSGLSTGTVKDTLPTGISSTVFGEEETVMNWELNSTAFTKTEQTRDLGGGKKETVFTYTKTYTVTIKPDAEGLKTTQIGGDLYAPLNGETTLTVKSGDTNVEIPFPIPAGKVTPKEYTVKGIIDNGGKVNNTDSPYTEIVESGKTSTAMTFTPATGYVIDTITEKIGSADAKNITGSNAGKDSYTYAAKTVTADITVTVTTKKRADLSYTIKYVEEGTTNEIKPADTVDNQEFGAEINVESMDKPTITGYTYKSCNPTGKLTIGTDVNQNVITLYYTRNKHKVTYAYTGNVPDGAAALPKDAEYSYDDNVTIAAAPAAVPGYTFEGWKRGTADAEDFKMPDEDVRITGNWTKNGDAGYTIEYYLETLDGQSFVKDDNLTITGRTGTIGTTASVMDADKKQITGFTFDADNVNNVLSDTISADGSLTLRLYYTRNSYKVKYQYTGTVTPEDATKLPDEATYKYGAEVTVAAAATSEDYIFSGWSSTGTFNMPAENVTITGSWKLKDPTAVNVDLNDHIYKTFTSDTVDIPNDELTFNVTVRGTSDNAKTMTRNGSVEFTKQDVQNNTTSKAFTFASDPLTFTAAGEYTFEVVEGTTPVINGLTYNVNNETPLFTIVVDKKENANELYVKEVRVGTTNYEGVALTDTLAYATITNTYTEPKNAQVTNKEVVVTQPEGALKTAVNAFEIPSQVTVLYPTGNGTTSNTLEVSYGTTEATLLYKITVYAGTESSYTFEDKDASFVYAENAKTVTKNGDYFTVTFEDGAEYAYVYVAVTHAISYDADGEYKARNFIGSQGAETTVTEKDPNKLTINFADYVQKELTATGTKTASDVDFTVDVKGKEQTMIIASAEGEEAISTYADEFDPKYSRTLTAHFDGITGGEVKTTRFTSTTVEIDHAGHYTFFLGEEKGTRTGVTYDEARYTLYINVRLDQNENKLYVSSMGAIRTNSDGTWENIALIEMVNDKPVRTTNYITFHNTIDTGKDDYYPIIIPTIINKDTGMLNKTDHFAYVIGYPDGTVHPNGQITRAEVATIFFRLLRDEVRDGAFTTSNSYSDVAYGKWYNNPISTMSALGIITGYPDGTFKPNKPITRAEFAAIAARFDETQSGKSATFSDVIGHWAAKEIGIAYYNDWIKGYPDGTFKPDQNITRAEAMTLINRVLERKPESPADLLTNMNKWTDNLDTSKWYYLDVQEATNSHGYTRKTFNYELWRQMLPDPDWSRYER